MDEKKIFSHVDHTLLTQTAKKEEMHQLFHEAVSFGAASVCIPPSFVTFASEQLHEKMKICTVIGFPNGYSTTRNKVNETDEAISSGACEIDMVINLGMLKDKRYSEIKNEIVSVKSVCGELCLKVIVETCFLTQEEKERMCTIVADSGADYIKTSTGFGTGNATFEDVALFEKCLRGTGVKIKASGGIKTLEDAARFLELGAERLGSSSLLKTAAAGSR